MKNKTKYILILYIILLVITTILFYDAETLKLIPLIMLLAFPHLIFSFLKHPSTLDANSVRMTPIIYSFLKNFEQYHFYYYAKINPSDSKWNLMSIFLDKETNKLYCSIEEHINPVELSNISYITDYKGQVKQYIINFKREINHNTYLGTFLSTLNKQDIR